MSPALDLSPPFFDFLYTIFTILFILLDRGSPVTDRSEIEHIEYPRDDFRPYPPPSANYPRLRQQVP